jgi:hypothetical protein
MGRREWAKSAEAQKWQESRSARRLSGTTARSSRWHSGHRLSVRAATCRVATFMRFQTLVIAIQRIRAESAGSPPKSRQVPGLPGRSAA